MPTTSLESSTDDTQAVNNNQAVTDNQAVETECVWSQPWQTVSLHSA